MPVRRLKTAMNLYQPSGMKGKLLKCLFPYLHWNSAVRRILQAEAFHCALRNDIYQLLCRVFGVEKLVFSVFGGTPSVHQKITIQLTAGNRILGYCKLSDNDETISLFHGETRILKTLRDRRVMDIPQCLFCGRLQDGTGIFIQSTMKTNNSKTVHKWTKLQEQFLANMYEKTKQELLFEDTDYYQMLLALKQHLEWLPDNIDKNIVELSIYQVMSAFCGKKVEFSAYHADFTPWNMFVERNRLFVFDFEYARMTCPPKLDRYHFFSQTAIFERHWSANEILEYIQSDAGKWINKQMYIFYLLDVMSRFTMREKGNIEGDVAKSLTIWSSLLKHLLP
jgi:hypothetical protein